MGYKCEYDGKRACDNCKYRYGSGTCKKCNTVGNTCPSVRGCKYPHDKGVCKKCLFEPEEREVTEVTAISFPKTNYNEKESATTAVFPPHEKVSASTVTATTLKNCICGGLPQEVCKTSMPPYYVISCPKCGKSTDLCRTYADAKKAWNAIAEEAPTKAIGVLKDSGERREFDTGAVRDMSEGKGLMVVMPAAAILRLSKHYEHGAKKYGKFNWQKGIPVDSFIDSALRHIFKYLDGWDDEDHLAAAAFNILGAMEMEAHKPDMQNIPAREGKQKFNYLNDKRV